MKRRNFLTQSTALSVVTLLPASTLLCGSILSSQNQILDEMSPESRLVFDNFINDLSANLKENGFESRKVIQLNMPSKIVKNKPSDNGAVVFISNGGRRITINKGALKIA